jgi:iron complex transport system substrate-binding protein
MRDINEITREIVDSAYRLHSRLGPGMLESVYRIVLAKDLERAGFQVEQEKSISFKYEGMTIENGFRVDLLVDKQVVVELKSIETLAPIHSKQVLTYLRVLDLPVGLLINFGSVSLKQGLQRIANARASSAGVVLTGR